MKGAWAALLGAAITGTALTLGILLAPLVAPAVWDARVRTTLQLVGDALICLRIVGGMGIVALGIAIAILIEHWRALNRKNKMVYADEKTNMFPGIPDHWRIRIIASERTQTASAITKGGRPLAATVKTVLAEQLPPPPLQLEAQPLQLPERVSIYDLPKPPALSMTFGQSAQGPLIFQLADLDNIIIAGLRGMGKTEYLAAMIAYLLRQDATGQSVKLALMDLKALDFALVPPDLAALWCPVARTPDEALVCIRAMHAEMLTRRTTLKDANADHIESYRQVGGDMPYLFGIIDELALMTTGATPESKTRSAEFIDCALEIGRIGRAMGVTLTMATQLTSGENIPIPLRDNCGIQVAFRLPNPNASRSVLAMSGAEELPRIPGRALVRRGGDPIPVQGYYADRSGRFRQFLSEMPRLNGTVQKPVPELVQKPVYQIESLETAENATKQAGIPVSVPQDREPFDNEAVMQYIYQRYQVLGSLKAVEAEIYGQEGGAKFYWVRHSVATMRRQDRTIK